MRGERWTLVMQEFPSSLSPGSKPIQLSSSQIHLSDRSSHQFSSHLNLTKDTSMTYDMYKALQITSSNSSEPHKISRLMITIHQSVLYSLRNRLYSSSVGGW
mmetsp:Transcript_151/g.302  ORF Transcript_151/g.302 Transcript_151/m.302 type:complete len:102 (+) Transcript_151:96-401(+)